MLSGVVPRQPANTGRHEGARTIARGLRKQKGADGVSARDLGKYRQGSKRPGNVQAAPALKSKAGRTEKSKRYDPLAPERIQEILRRLDQQYPGVTCALTHRNAWELLVATILSAQATDVRVNMVTPELFRKNRPVENLAPLLQDQLRPDIIPKGCFRNNWRPDLGAAKK